MQHHDSFINGLVLCGGQSTRMGKDKGEIFYHDKTQRHHVYEMLSFKCAATFISCNAEQSKYINGMPKIEDAFTNTGPLGGILSAFKYNAACAWLAVACDMPFLNNETISYLIKHRNTSKIATAFWNAEADYVEPLITIWEANAYPVLMNFFTQGNKSPGKILMSSDTELLHAPDVSLLRNVNTEEEYKEAIKLTQKKS